MHEKLKQIDKKLDSIQNKLKLLEEIFNTNKYPSYTPSFPPMIQPVCTCKRCGVTYSGNHYCNGNVYPGTYYV